MIQRCLSDAHCIIGDGDRADIVEAIVEKTLIVTTSRNRDWEVAIKALNSCHDLGYFAFGIHPWHLLPETIEQDVAALDELLKRFPSARVGEIGLDKARKGIATLHDQMHAFAAMFDLACTHQRSVSVHVVRAHGSLLDFLRNRDADSEKLPRGIYLHSWSGSADITRDILRLKRVGPLIRIGFSWKINGMRIDEHLKAVLPPERILLESDLDITDPSRGPFLLLMARRLEEIYGLTVDQLDENFRKFLRLME